jgi:hypothetical protein
MSRIETLCSFALLFYVDVEVQLFYKTEHKTQKEDVKLQTAFLKSLFGPQFGL